MALFRRKKKVVKPTVKEQKRITTRLQRQYPQMYESRIGAREKVIIGRASPGDRAALEKMVGKRLKRKYRKK